MKGPALLLSLRLEMQIGADGKALRDLDADKVRLVSYAWVYGHTGSSNPQSARTDGRFFCQPNCQPSALGG